MTKDEALNLLKAAGVFFETDEEEDDFNRQTINLNDVFGWACADGEEVADNELVEVATLLNKYGWCGILYWVSKKRGGMRSEFLDVNRFIDFADMEEKLIQEEPDTDKRAYKIYKYTLGAK